jgi:hypothetical protein
MMVPPDTNLTSPTHGSTPKSTKAARPDLDLLRGIKITTSHDNDHCCRQSIGSMSLKAGLKPMSHR